MQDVKGKTAFVTGGASGIGLGIAKALHEAGANVVVADIRDDHLERARAVLGETGVLAAKLDVTDREAFVQVADRAEGVFGPIHILVANAGVAVMGPVGLASYGDWDWTLGVNLGGTINAIITLLPRMQAHGHGGHIVCTASMSGLLPHAGAAIYATSKAAIVGLCEAIRPELETEGIGVSAFCPGPVQSNISEAGKTRPEKFNDTGYAESDRRRQQGGNHDHLYMTADEAGQRVVAGIRNGELYILTHSEFAHGVRDRLAAIEAALPRRPANEALKQLFPHIFRNPAHAEEAQRQAQLGG